MHRVKEKPGDVRVVAFDRILPGRGQDRTEQSTRAELARFEGTVIVDLSGVVFLDLPRLSALLRFRADVRAGGGEVGLAALSRRVRLQAQKMQLHRLVEIFNTVEEVFRSLTNSSSFLTDLPEIRDKRQPHQRLSAPGGPETSPLSKRSVDMRDDP